MKKRIALGAIALAGIVAFLQFGHGPATDHAAAVPGGDRVLARAFDQHARDVPVEDRGTVTRILSDDREGSRHQRFIVRLASGQTVLIAYNIDIARRIEGLEAGDLVEFRGEYEWNAAGGVVHWTHADPAGRHAAGWIKVHGETFQ